MKGLFSGAYILKTPASEKLTRLQTAGMARRAIKEKYGEIKPTGHYFHAGKGVWKQWIIANDRKRTGKLADTKVEWAKRPHRLDYPDIDTKGAAGQYTLKVSKVEPSTPDIKKRIMALVESKTNWKRRHIGQNELKGALYEFTDGKRRYRFTNRTIEVYVPGREVTKIAYSASNILLAIRAAERAAYS